MSDDNIGRSRGWIDEAIDRTVRALTGREAPRDLRTRVLARLSEARASSAQRPAPGARSLWTLQRLAWACVALPAVVVVVLWASRWRERPAPPSTPPAIAEREPAPAVSPPPAPGTTAAAEARIAPSPVETMAQPRVAGRVPEVVTAAFVERAERPPFIDPLPAPDRIAIAPLESERVTPAPVEIEPLKVDPALIEPLQAQR